MHGRFLAVVDPAAGRMQPAACRTETISEEGALAREFLAGRDRPADDAIEVSPIGAAFFSVRGWWVLQSELLWVWVPAAGLAATALAVRARFSR